MRYEIVTPESHPDHNVVGHFFKGGVDGAFYYCDSYDSRIGFWLTPLPGQLAYNDGPAKRKNVSERAIGGVFAEIYLDDDHAYCRFTLPPEFKELFNDRERLKAAVAALDTSDDSQYPF